MQLRSGPRSRHSFSFAIGYLRRRKMLKPRAADQALALPEEVLQPSPQEPANARPVDDSIQLPAASSTVAVCCRDVLGRWRLVESSMMTRPMKCSQTDSAATLHDQSCSNQKTLQCPGEIMLISCSVESLENTPLLVEAPTGFLNKDVQFSGSEALCISLLPHASTSSFQQPGRCWMRYPTPFYTELVICRTHHAVATCCHHSTVATRTAWVGCPSAQPLQGQALCSLADASLSCRGPTCTVILRLAGVLLTASVHRRASPLQGHGQLMVHLEAFVDRFFKARHTNAIWQAGKTRSSC